MMGGWWVWTYTVLMRRFQMQPSKGTLGRCTPVSMSVGMPPMKSRWMLRGWSLGNGCWKGGSSSTCTVNDLHTHAPLVSKRPAWANMMREIERERGWAYAPGSLWMRSECSLPSCSIPLSTFLKALCGFLLPVDTSTSRAPLFSCTDRKGCRHTDRWDEA